MSHDSANHSDSNDAADTARSASATPHKKATAHKAARAPLAIFDTLAHITHQLNPGYRKQTTPMQAEDFARAKTFLLQYRGSKTTFAAYRREVERLLQWAWHIRKSSVLKLQRVDLEDYINFCMRPPQTWIGHKRCARFKIENGQRVANPIWRLFLLTQSKAAHHTGESIEHKKYTYSQQAMSATFIAIGSFYSYLHSENLVAANPVALIRQKSKYIQKQQSQRKVRRLNELQWDFVIETAQLMAQQKPAVHERTLFIMSILYLLYLRISELVADQRWAPKMGDFFCDSQGSYWFQTVSKGNKLRNISVGKPMLNALIRYRRHLQLTPDLPVAGDTTPLICKLNSQTPITSDRQIRNVVQACFDNAMTRLAADGFADDASALQHATVHWLRHTGISDDINRYQRPIAHVRDDAGHSSSATTDRYNDIALQERHHSGQRKQIRPDDMEQMLDPSTDAEA